MFLYTGRDVPNLVQMCSDWGIPPLINLYVIYGIRHIVDIRASLSSIAGYKLGL